MLSVFPGGFAGEWIFNPPSRACLVKQEPSGYFNMLLHRPVFDKRTFQVNVGLGCWLSIVPP